MRLTVLRNIFRPDARLALATVLAVLVIVASTTLALNELTSGVVLEIPK